MCYEKRQNSSSEGNKKQAGRHLGQGGIWAQDGAKEHVWVLQLGSVLTSVNYVTTKGHKDAMGWTATCGHASVWGWCRCWGHADPSSQGLDVVRPGLSFCQGPCLQKPGSMLIFMASVSSLGSGLSPEARRVCEDHDAARTIQIWVTLGVTKCHDGIQVQATTQGHVCVYVPTTAKVCADVCGSWCHQRTCQCLESTGIVHMLTDGWQC